MQIMENLPHRVVLEIRSRAATLFLLAAMLVWTPLWALPPALLCQRLLQSGAAAVPAWAGLIGAVSLALFALGLWVILRCLRALMRDTSRRLEFDLAGGRVLLTETGLLRRTERSFSLAGVRIATVTRKGEDETWEVLSVTAEPADGAERVEIWDTALSSPHLSPGQRQDLDALFARLGA